LLVFSLITAISISRMKMAVGVNGRSGVHVKQRVTKMGDGFATDFVILLHPLHQSHFVMYGFSFSLHRASF